MEMQWKEQLMPKGSKMDGGRPEMWFMPLDRWALSREETGEGFPRQREQQIQRDTETQETVKKRNEWISKKLPSEVDLPLLQWTAATATENRLDGIIWKADHCERAISAWYWLDKAGGACPKEEIPKENSQGEIGMIKHMLGLDSALLC